MSAFMIALLTQSEEELRRLALVEARMDAILFIADPVKYSKTRGQEEVDRLVRAVREAYAVGRYVRPLAFEETEPRAARCGDEYADLLNAYRALMGRRTLRLLPELCAAARAHAADLRRRRVLEHGDPVGRARKHGYAGTAIGENLAMAGSAREAHEAWYRSAPHHRNMLCDRYEYVGVGCDGEYWVAMFGGPADIEISPWREAALFGAESSTVEGTAVAEGNVRSNKTVKLKGNVTVDGDLVAPSIVKSGQPSVTGQEKKNAAPLVWPSLQSYIGSQAGGDLKLNGASLTLTKGIYFYKSLTMTAGAELKVEGRVTICVAGKVDIAGQAKLNVDGDACDLRILSAGDVKIAGGAQGRLFIYAMMGEAHLTGESDVTGAVAAKTARLSGSARLHFHACEKANSIVVPMDTVEPTKQFGK